MKVEAEDAPPQLEKFVLELAAIYGLDEHFMRALPVPTMEMWMMLVRDAAIRHKSERETMEKFRAELNQLKFGAESVVQGKQDAKICKYGITKINELFVY